MKKIKKGDIYSIPISDEIIGLCQVIEIKKDSFFIIVFEDIISEKNVSYQIENVLKSSILFFGETTDARIYHNIWKLIDNKKPIIDESYIPLYKVKTLTGTLLVDYKGNKIKKISKEESVNFNFESSYSPIRFENALKAFHKITDWVEEYNKILYNRDGADMSNGC